MFQYINQYKDGLNKPEGVSVDNNGNIYIADTTNHRLIKLNYNMEYITQFGITGSYKSDNTGLRSPRGVFVDSNGNIYIADSSNHRLIKLNSNMKYITQFGITGTYKTDNTGLYNPNGVSIDNIGNIYIADTNNHRVIKLNSNMEYISQFGTTRVNKSDNTGLNEPINVCIDKSNNIYISDRINSRLVKLNSNMEYEKQFGTTGVSKTDNTGLNYPRGVSVDNNGNIYVADCINNRIVKLNSNMEYITQFGTIGVAKTDNTGLNNPYAVSVDSNGNIYIADSYNNRIMVVKHIAQYEKQFGVTGVIRTDNTGFNFPFGVVKYNDFIYVCDYKNYRLVKLDSDMNYISQFGETGVTKSDNTGLKGPIGCSVDKYGNIYLSDLQNHRVVKLNSNMEYVSQFGTTGTYKSDNTGLYNPMGTAVDSNGNIFITDSMNHRLVKLNSNMEYVGQFGTTGVARLNNTGLNIPGMLCIDSYDNIYITDNGNDRLVKLNSNLEYVSQFGITDSPKSDNTGLKTPIGVAVDSKGYLYVTDCGNHRLVKISPNMEYVCQFGTTYSIKSDNTGLNNARGVFIDASNNIYITDSDNHRLIKLKSLLFEILCKIIQYINTPSLLDIDISDQVDTLRILVNEQEKVLLNNISSYKYNLDKIWNELLLENNIIIETNKGDKSLSITKPTIPETKMYTNTIKDVVFEYSVNPSYDNTNNPLSFIYSISLDGKVLYSQDTPQTDSVASSISIPYNDLVISNYKNITDRNLVIQKTNVDSGELINYNIPIRIDPKRLFSKYFNGLLNYISIKDWVKPLSELTIQVVKKSSTDLDFTVSIDNSLVSLVGSELKIGGISTFVGNIYEIRVWEKGKEQPYTYDQLYGNEDGLYALYRLNEYNSTNVYNSCRSILHGKYTGKLINQEIIPTDSNYLTKVNINNKLNDIVKQKEDYEYRYNIESKNVLYENINTNNEQEILLPLNNLSILHGLFIKKDLFDTNYKVGDLLPLPESGWQRIDDRDPNISYPISTSRSTSSSYYNSTLTSASNGEIKIRFKGNRFRLISYKHYGTSIRPPSLIINADGDITENINLYALNTYKVLIYEKIFDTNDIHTITISILTNTFHLDAIDIDEYGYLLPIT